MNLKGLAKHMSLHNSPFSAGMITGLLIDMVECIKELLLEGKNVKIDDLAIFSLGIKNKNGGAETEEEFTVAKHIEGVRLRARATGELTAKSLNLEATLKKATYIGAKAKVDDTADPTTGEDPTAEGGSTEGGTTQGGGGSTEGGSTGGAPVSDDTGD